MNTNLSVVIKMNNMILIGLIFVIIIIILFLLLLSALQEINNVCAKKNPKDPSCPCTGNSAECCNTENCIPINNCLK